MAHPHTHTRLTRFRRYRTLAALLTAVTALTISGCASPEPSTGDQHPAVEISHVHGIVSDPAGSGFLLGTHDGIFTATADGNLGPRVAGPTFDAMGLAVVDGTLLASGHPDRTTPAELGTPHLGIIRSTNGARTWTPVAFTGEKDFHVLATGPDGTVYGQPTDNADILASTDQGATWTSTGVTLLAFNLVVDATGRLIASTPDGLQVSTDSGASFIPWSDTPILGLLSVSPDRERIVGVGSGGKIWAATTGDPGWTVAGTVHGTAQAIAITDSGDMLVVDDSGLTALPSPDTP